MITFAYQELVSGKKDGKDSKHGNQLDAIDFIRDLLRGRQLFRYDFYLRSHEISTQILGEDGDLYQVRIQIRAS